MSLSASETPPLPLQQIAAPPAHNRLYSAVYLVALATSISTWFSAVRAPLWLDETISYWQIDAGWFTISSRQGLSRPAYSYILWIATKLLGTSELALRIPSILAMLAAAYLLYRAARELFDRDISIIATIVFCLHPVVIFAAIDVRPYAFGVLAINATILCLFRLRRSDSLWLAALFGLLAGSILHFQLLFAVILPSLVICFFAWKSVDWKTRWRQFGVALVAFVVAFIPVLPGIRYMFHTSAIHVWDEAPSFSDLGITIAPAWPLFFLTAAALLLAAFRRSLRKQSWKDLRFVLCGLLGIVPILLLFGVSRETSVHVFVERYRLVAIPGIALCWGCAVSVFESRWLRLLFCVVFVGVTAFQHFTSEDADAHSYTWKYALEVAEKNAAPDNAPVLICSDFPEADYLTMPTGEALKDSNLFAPLSYYKLSVPVVGLPRDLNDEAMREANVFLRSAAHQRFLALAYAPSYDTLDWLTEQTADTHLVREVGTYDDVKVLEFTPRS